MPFTKFPKTRRILSTIAGVLYIWIVVGNLLGHLLIAVSDGQEWSHRPIIINGEVQFDNNGEPETHYGPPENCYPAYGMFGNVEAHCQKQMWNIFWVILVGIPTFFTIFYSMALNFAIIMYPDAILWGFYSAILTLLILYPGFNYWFRRSKIIATCSISLFVSIVIYVAL